MKRLIAAALLAISLSACAPGITATIPTPTAQLTYGWVMVHHGYDWWVQIGPKSDGDGYHIAVQGWISCQTGLTTVPTCASYNFFQEYDTLVPGVPHDYRLWWNGAAWECHFRLDAQHPWRVIATIPGVGNATDYKTEINYSERTQS